MKKRILFVCLGNICRSPAAEGIFRSMIEQQGLADHFDQDSAGTGSWHVGAPPDARMIHHAKIRNYQISDLRARRFNAQEDFEKFDLIVTMDDANHFNVLNTAQNEAQKNKVRKMTSYCKIHQVNHVPDPYERDEDGFEHVLDILEDACTELILKLKNELPK